MSNGLHVPRVWRKHKMLLLRDLSFTLSLVTATITTAALLSYFGVMVAEIWRVVAWCFLVELLYTAYATYDWYRDIYWLSTSHVGHLERVPWLFRRGQSCRLEKILGLTFVQSSFVERRCDYGDIIIRTSGWPGEIRFVGVPHPFEVRQIIDEYCRHRTASAAEILLEELGRGVG